jgi:flavin-binding protein dodecin
MSVLKVIEIQSSSDRSWADATEKAVSKATQTVQQISSKSSQSNCRVADGKKNNEYKVKLKMIFETE